MPYLDHLFAALEIVLVQVRDLHGQLRLVHATLLQKQQRDVLEDGQFESPHGPACLDQALQEPLELARVLAQLEGGAFEKTLVRVKPVLVSVLARAPLALRRARPAGAPTGWRRVAGDGRRACRLVSI